MAWPSATELVAYAAAQGIVLDASDAAALLVQAIVDFEAMTGHSPFYADGTASARTVPTARSVVLDLQCGAQSVTLVTVEGTDLDADAYRLVWRGVPGQPRSWIRGIERSFDWGPWSDGGPELVTVTADWGAVPTGSSLASGVNRAVMDRALSLNESATGGAYTEIKQGPVTLKYGSGGSVSERRDSNFSSLVGRWARVVV